jgi:hypothetical protein
MPAIFGNRFIGLFDMKFFGMSTESPSSKNSCQAPLGGRIERITSPRSVVTRDERMLHIEPVFYWKPHGLARAIFEELCGLWFDQALIPHLLA